MLLSGPRLHSLWSTPFLPFFFLMTCIAMGYSVVVFESVFSSVVFKRGLEVPMLTTELTSAADPNARPILSTAARLKIPFFKLGYWPYRTDPGG